MTNKLQNLELEGSYDGVEIEAKAAGKRPRTAAKSAAHISRSDTDTSYFIHTDTENDGDNHVDDEYSPVQSRRATSELNETNIAPAKNTSQESAATQTGAVASPTTPITNATVSGIDGHWIRIYEVDGGVKVIKSIDQVPGEEVIVFDKSKEGPDRVQVLSKHDKSIDREYQRLRQV